MNIRNSVSILLAAALCLALAGCGTAQTSGGSGETGAPENSASASGQEEASASSAPPAAGESAEGASSAAPDTEEPEKSAGAVAVYFSRVGNTEFPSDVDAEAGASLVERDGAIKGNAQLMAEWIADAAGCDTFEIQTETPYPADYSETTETAREEQNQGSRPGLTGQLEGFDRYETVYLVFPNWWGDLPQALYTFFDSYDFAGKTLNVFVTHGGSSFSNTLDTIRSLEPEAEVVQGLSVQDSDVPDAENDLRDWVASANQSRG